VLCGSAPGADGGKGMEVYEEGKCIGRGNYGSAHVVTDKGTQLKYVVKKVSTSLLSEEEQAQTQQVRFTLYVILHQH
jgi:hypothetical protein